MGKIAIVSWKRAYFWENLVRKYLKIELSDIIIIPDYSKNSII